jgi:hypothetical protein
MTAIHPARLKHQTAALRAHYLKPDRFIAELHKLLDFYADRVRRSGQSGHPPPALPSYRVPRPVLSQVVRELKPELESRPSRGLLLVDALWKEEWLETRLLAGSLIAVIPPINPEPLFKRLKSWAVENREPAVLEGLIHQGLAGLYGDYPEQCEALAAELISDAPDSGNRAGLAALEMLVRQPSYGNLPFVFRSLERLLEGDPEPRRELISLMKQLVQASEQETFFFLQKLTRPEPSQELQRVIRRCLAFFSEENQIRLREILRSGR